MPDTFLITDFGAVADGKTLQTAAVQAAIDACFAAGGGEVVVPRGVFCIGGVRLRSHITLRLCAGAVLTGSRDPEDYFAHLHDKIEPLDPAEITDALPVSTRDVERYDPADHRLDADRLPASRWNNALIRVLHAENVAIIGEGDAVIDGSNCYDPLGEEHYRGPHAVSFFDVQGVTLRGYSVRDSANWAHKLNYCRNVEASGITVLAGHDGFHAFNCVNVWVHDCVFYTGDDCVAGFADTNVLVEDCTLNSACSGMRFGGTNVLVQRCRFEGVARYAFRGGLSKEEKERGVASAEYPGRHMLSAFTYYADPSCPIPDQPGHILIKNCVFENANRFLHYNFSGNERWQRCRPLSDITFEDVTAAGVAIPLTAYGTQDTPIALTLRRVRVSMREGIGPTPFARVCYFSGITLEDVTVTGASDCLLLARSKGEITAKNVVSDPPVDLVRYTDEEFVIDRI